MKSPPLLASLLLLSACAAIRPDHTEPKDLPPPPREEISWESLFWEPWGDPLHEKYAELFGKPYPNAGRQHFETDHPFDDVKKFQLAFEQEAFTAARTRTPRVSSATATGSGSPPRSETPRSGSSRRR